MGRLIEFYGTECVHCKEIEPLIRKLAMEDDIEVERLEVWHDSKNAELFKKAERGRCGGVPFFWNEATDQFICGNTTYEKLKDWAKGSK